MPKLKPGTVIPSIDEDKAITKEAQSDRDAAPFTDEEWATAKPLARVGRPPLDVTKERITIRLSHDVVERFRTTGKGWQTRMDEALKQWIKEHGI